MEEKTPERILVKQVRGDSGRVKEVKRTLSALGLGRIGKERAHNVNAALVGMLRKVEHLIEIKAAE